MANNNPFILCPECVSSRAKLKGVLADFFPTEKIKINIILAAYDECIAGAINKANQLDNILAGRYIKLLVGDYGISEANAQWAVAYWFDNYGVEVLGKANSFKAKPEKAQTRKTQSNESVIAKPTTNTQVVTPPDSVVDLTKVELKEKLPKSLIQRFPDEEQRQGISNFRCSITKDYSFRGYCHLKLTGELTGNIPRYTLLMIMVYNANNELIGASFDEKIEQNLNGKKTLSVTVQTPNDEYISRIVVRFVPDPVFT